MANLLIGLLEGLNLVDVLLFLGGIVFFVAKLEASTKASRDLFNNELNHITKMMELNHKNLREDISRLERKQEESNRIKERLAMQEVMVADLQALVRSHIHTPTEE